MAARTGNSQKEPQLPDAFRELKDIQLFFEPQVLLALAVTPQEVATPLPPYLAYLPEAPIRGIFRPPAA